MNTRRALRTAAAVAVLGLTLVGSLLGFVGSAHAAGDGELTFIPGKGLDTDPVYLVLPVPCPAQATSTIGNLSGKGFPAGGINVVPISPAGMRHDEAFGVPLQNALKNFAAMNGAQFSGAYTFTVRCTDRLGSKTFASFTGIMTFSDPTHWTATKASTPPAYGVPLGVAQWVYPELHLAAAPPAAPPASGQVPAAGQAPAASQPAGAQPSGAGAPSPAAGLASAAGQAAPSSAGGSAGAQGSQPSSAAVPATKASSSSLGGSGIGFGLGAIAVLLALAYVVLKRRERTVSQLGSSPTANWPDKEPDKEPAKEHV